jgi:hypothetical protein
MGMRKIIISFALLWVAGVTNLTATAQDSREKNRAEKERTLKEKQLQRKEIDSIAQQSKGIYEDELKRLLEEKGHSSSSDVLELKPGDTWKQVDAEVFTKGIHFPSYFGPTMFLGQSMGTGDNTSFNINKRLKESTTFNGDFEFSVPDKASSLTFVFAGGLEQGSLKVTILKPDKKVFQEFKVSPIADVNWNKKINIKEEELKDYMGSWKINIVAQDAKGYYELRISTY